MHVLFINYHKFENTSGIHIHFLANALVDRGVECTVCVPSSPGSVFACGDVRYRAMSFREANIRALSGLLVSKEDSAVIHAWTPREIVRRECRKLSGMLKAPYFVHMEDNETSIFESHVGVSVVDFGKESLLRRLMLSKNFIHPDKYLTFLAEANGISCIIKQLEALVPESVPKYTFWPACEDLFYKLPLKPDRQQRAHLGIASDSFVITYTGNIHRANLQEMEQLYEAVAVLNAKGLDVTLVRCGNDHEAMDGQLLSRLGEKLVSIGTCPAKDLIRYIGCADALVQPGAAGPFNDYRFPSKLPMFLASGRPVVLPDTNVGTELEDGYNCLKLKSGSASEIVEKVEELIAHPSRRSSLGVNGRKFAQDNFNWGKSVEGLMEFYLRNM